MGIVSWNTNTQSQNIDKVGISSDCYVRNISPNTRAVITAELVLGAGGERQVGEVAGLCGL